MRHLRRIASHLGRTVSRSIVVAVCWAFCLPTVCYALPPELQGYDPSGQVRFDTAAKADARRQKLIKYVWSGGLPTKASPGVTRNIQPFLKDLRGVTKSLVSQVDRLDFDIRVAGHRLPSIAYLVRPSKPAASPRLGIVHQGHQGGLGDGINSTINHLLGEGSHVVAMQMPLTGWNARTVTLPDGATISLRGGTKGHNAMFRQLSGTLKGGLFAFFLEPIVQSINHFVAQNPDGLQDVTMIGLSGGGWTTHMAAAVDDRIDLSIPVAGALPLYARPYSKGSGGDVEQIYAPLYREIDGPDADKVRDTADGVASWLEVFALGGYGAGRGQIQVLNVNDSCCFGGDVFKTYRDFVSGRVKTIGKGDWDFVSDTSHRRHAISLFTIQKVLAPAIDALSRAKPDSNDHHARTMNRRHYDMMAGRSHAS